MEENNQETRSTDSDRGTLLSQKVLCIKLRIPKVKCNEDKSVQNGDDGGDHRGEERSRANNSSTLLCPFCGKEFTSGKALGGHTRIHMQSNKDLPRNKKIHESKIERNCHDDSSESSASAASAGNDNLTCVICGKSFPSMKSLFGHMRSHPERKWRGIQPPSDAAKKISPSTSSSDMKADDQTDSDNTKSSASNNRVDLSKCMPGWLVTAKRGKKSTASITGSGSGSGSASATGPCAGFDEEDELVQQALLMLANGNTQIKALRLWHKTKIDAIEEDDHCLENTPIGVSRPIYEGSSFPSQKAKICDGEGSSSSTDLANSKCCSETSQVVIKIKDEEKSKLEDKKAMKNPHHPQTIENGTMDFEVIKCEASPPLIETVRKLKKKRKRRLRDLEEVHAADLVNKNNNESVTDIPGAVPVRVRFRCSLCDKSFSTHQALGGHKSSHSKLPKNNTSGRHTMETHDEFASGNLLAARNSHKKDNWRTSSGSRVDWPGEGSEQTARKVRDFDLNVPAMEDEEGG